MKIIIKNIGRKGKGVFAAKNFKKGDIILHSLYKNQKVYTKSDLIKLPIKKRDRANYIGDGKYVIDLSLIGMVNHSCNPNSYVRYKTMMNKDLIALRNIKRGEEICCYYAIDSIGNWKMRCYCKNRNCRKYVYGNYFKLPNELQKKYWKYVPKWKKKMLKSN